jgi:hypothetical protein
LSSNSGFLSRTYGVIICVQFVGFIQDDDMKEYDMDFPFKDDMDECY